MLANKIVGHEIPNPLIERSRALEIGEQERKTCDLQPLIDIKRVGAKQVAESLIGEEALGRKERPAPAEQMVQLVTGNPKRREHATVGAIFERQSQGPGPHRDRPDGRRHLVEHDR